MEDIFLAALCSTLRNLEVLDIGFNDLTNDILPSLEGFTSLKELYLYETGLDSDLHMEGIGCNFCVSLIIKLNSGCLVLNEWRICSLQLYAQR